MSLSRTPAPGPVVPDPVRPGAITALIAELVRAPVGSGWDEAAMPGEIVGRFEIVRELGRGGFGIVYEARDVELGRRVALKAVRADSPVAMGGDAALAEAEVAARLAHPNIVRLYDLGRCARGAYLVLELLDGEPLRDRLRRGPVGLAEAVRILVEVARGVAHAHAAGVVHRDLTPANVFLCDDGQVKILDFGLAGLRGRRAVAGGTQGYAAPEQARGEGDARSDVYALGVMLHELVAGTLPAPRDAQPDLGAGDPPPALPRAPARVARLAAHMVARDPDRRPASAREVLARLEAIQRASAARRRLVPWIAAAALAMAAGVALWRFAPAPGRSRVSVMLADAINTTGDPELDDVAMLMTTALGQSRRVSLVAWSAPDGERPPREGVLDEARAVDGARRAGTDVVLVPAVRNAGERLEVEIRGIDAARGEPLFAFRERAGGKGSLPDAVDALSARVLRELKLGGASEVAPLPLTLVLPVNAEARRLYEESTRLRSEGWPAEATAALRQALLLEPDSPLLHAELAGDAEGVDEEETQRHIRAAMRSIDRVPAKERLMVEAVQAGVEGRFGDAIDRYDRVIAGWPLERRAYLLAGLTYVHRFGDLGSARPYLEKVLQLPGGRRVARVRILSQLGRYDEALREARRWTEESPGRAAFEFLAKVHRLRGEQAEALAAERRSSSFPGGPPLGMPFVRFWNLVEANAVDEVERACAAAGKPCWDLLFLQGRWREGLAAFDAEAPAPDAPALTRAHHHKWRAALLAGEGDADRTWTEVEEQLRLGSPVAACAAPDLAWLGDLVRARRLMELWSSADPRLYCHRLYRAVRDWKEGDRPRALGEVKTLYGPRAAYFLGLMLAETDDHHGAVDAFRRMRREPDYEFVGGNLHAYPRSLFLEARSLERLGEREQALALVERLLALWEHADPGIPMIEDARALRARLKRPSP